LFAIGHANLAEDKLVALIKLRDTCKDMKNKKENMSLLEIKKFLSVQASFVSHIKHANSYNLNQKTGVLNETNPFDYDRA